MRGLETELNEGTTATPTDDQSCEDSHVASFVQVSLDLGNGNTIKACGFGWDETPAASGLRAVLAAIARLQEKRHMSVGDESHMGKARAPSKTQTSLSAQLRFAKREETLVGIGNGPISAFVDIVNEALRAQCSRFQASANPVTLQVSIGSYSQNARGKCENRETSESVCTILVEVYVMQQSKVVSSARKFGVGVHENTSTASFLAVCSGLNRVLRSDLRDKAADCVGWAPVSHEVANTFAEVGKQTGKPTQQSRGTASSPQTTKPCVVNLDEVLADLQASVELNSRLAEHVKALLAHK
jgi:hypothetical protein